MLPFITSMFVHFEAVNILTEQSAQQAERVISLEQKEINQLYNICNTTYVSIMENSDVKNIIGMTSAEQLSSVVAYELKNDLARMLLDQNYILEDVWLIFNNINYGVSTLRAESLADFLAAEKSNGVMMVSSENLHQEHKGMFKRTPEGFAYFRTVGYSSNNSVINMVLFVNESRFREKNRELLPNESGIIMLYNSENQLIFSNRDVSDELSDMAKNITSEDAKVRIEGEKYISSSSDQYNIKHVYLLAEKTFTRPLQSLKMIIVITAFFSMLVGFWIIMYLLKRNIAPVNEIVDMLDSRVYDINEFDFIKHKIYYQNQERKKLNRENNLFKPMAMNNLIHNLVVYGNMDNYTMRHMDMRLDRKYLLLSVIDIDNMGIFFEGEDEDLMENNQRLMEIAVINIFTEILEKFGNVYCGLLQDRIVILINSNDDSSELIYENMVKGCELINQHFNITAYLAQGRTVFSVEELPEIYGTIQNQLENMQISGEHGAVLCDITQRLDSEIKNDSKMLFIKHIFDADCSGAIDIIQGIIKSSVPKGMKRYFIADMCADAAKELSRKTSDKVEAAEIVNLIMETPHIQTIEPKIKVYVKKLCDVSCDTSESLETKVHEFINHNFTDPDVNVATIAANFQITPAYLSYKFREHYHINILDYLGNLRIERAKYLLLETKRTIEDIYLECGYISRATFVRQFKKYTGLNPGKFKQLYS